jgi:hypothetical protein
MPAVHWSARLTAVASRIWASAGRLTLCGLAVGSMGLGVMWSFGILSHLGLLLVLISSGLAMLALRGGRWRQGRGWWMVITIGCGLTNLLYTRHFHHLPDLQVLFALLLTALTAAAAWLPRGRLSRVLLGLAGVSLVGLTAAGMFWGSADIDVFTALQGAAEALIHGHNPYGPVFRYFVEVKPNLFRTVAPNFVWGHFPYGPIVPLLAVPGRLLGDVRVMSMVCVLATVAGLWRLAEQGDATSDAHRVVALALASPLWVGMVHQGWVDVYMMVGIVWWLALRRDHRGWATVALTAGVMVKFTSLVLLLPAFLWSRRGRREIVLAVLCSLVVMVPFALITGVGTFVYSLVGYQLNLPFRTDSLSLAALLYHLTRIKLPTVLPFLPLAVGAAWITWRGRPRCEGDLALQAALLNVAAFILAKQAFFNYYFVTEVLLLAAMAGAGLALPEDDLALPDVAGMLGRVGIRMPPRRTPAAADTAARLTPPPTRNASWVPPTELNHPARRPPIGAGTPVKM